MAGSAGGRLLLAMAGVCMAAACGSPAGEWQSEPGYRWRTLAAPTGGRAGYRAVSPARTGVAAVNSVAENQIVTNRHFMHGSGVAIGDVDGDGLPDIYVARLMQPNVLYHNEGGWRFKDITQEAGTALAGYNSTGTALADIDGDGDLDLLVSMLGGPGATLLNDGTGRFEDVTSESGLASSFGSTTMTLADVDSDGDLDLYVGRYKRIALKDSMPPEEVTWEKVMQDSMHTVKPAFEDHYAFKRSGNKMLRLELGEPDGLYLNDGAGRFELVDWTAGTFLDSDGAPLSSVPRDWALTARFHDVNGDGFADLYVCNDFESPDALWLGDGQGTLRLAAPEALRKTSNATMSVDFSDIDRDGHVDMFLTDMLSRDYARRQRQRNTRIPIPIAIGDLEARPQEMQNMLFVSRGDGTFAEIANVAGVAASDWSWSTSFVDVDLDGYEDLLVTTGHIFDIQDLDAQAGEQQKLTQARGLNATRALLLDFPDLALRNVAFRNRGDRTFEAIPEGWGLGASADVSHGMALGDLDSDGDLDVVINRLNEVVALYENTAAAARIAVQLQGSRPNTHGVGATVRMQCPGLPVQQKEITAGGQYVSSSQMLAVFAATEIPCRIDVVWPGGTISSVPQALAGRHYEVAYQQAEQHASHAVAESAPFVRVQALPPHVESLYEDFARQPLLPRRLSQRGPGAAVADLDGDADPDFIAGDGMGGRLVSFLNEGGTLRRAGVSEAATGDMTGIVVLPDPQGSIRVLTGVSNYERTPETAGDSSFIQVYAVGLSGALHETQRLPFGPETPGPLALADLDGDQDLDLLVGGNFRPGAYPFAASSRIYRNTDGALLHDVALSRAFDRIGLVSGAALGDLDADGDTDVVLAREWGAICVMTNEGGAFVDRTHALGLGEYSGWWNGVAMGDFNEDGLLDIVATNWGWNLRYGSSQGVRLYYGDIDANGILDLFEAYLEPSLGAYVPTRQLGDLARGVPAFLRRFNSHAAFASSTLEEALGNAGHQLSYVAASTLSSTVFLNHGAYFEARPLPQEAQYTVATGVSVADINADGHDDLVLGQNYFALPISTPRQDAGRGLWLAGDGSGGFTPMPMSGLGAYGEGRAVVTADFDRDGRSDALLTQNGAEALLYRNQSQATGLRVRLAGPAANPWGVGAAVRIEYVDGTYGPARLVAAGSGYWSQDSPVLVLGKREPVAGVLVRWPGGRETFTTVAAEAEEILVQYQDP